MEETQINCDEDEEIEVIDLVGLNIDLYSNPSSPTSNPEQVQVSTELTSSETSEELKCNICLRRFKQKGGMTIHMKRMHNIGDDDYSVRCLEKECNFTCSYKDRLQQHLTEVHGIDMDITLKEFDSLQDFIRWKDEFEIQDKSRFVKKSGSRVTEEGVRVGYYYCSRSGSFVNQKRGLRPYKKKGSSKTNNCCTASITCVELTNGKVDVKVCSTHYGHDYELQHLRLTQSEKFQIAEQLVRGTPKELILDSVRATAGSNMDRIHLITLKDVKNIEKAYGITNYEQTDNINASLDTWIELILKTENSPVLLYKTEGVLNTKGYHLCLILLTTGQVDIINEFGTDGIYYVNTFLARSGQSYSAQCLRPPHIFITSLVLVDDINEPCPVCFMISNNIEDDKFLVLFESLKRRVPRMSAKVVLTDNQTSVFNKWCQAFEQQPYHAWSNRYVDDDWRENLISIPDEEVQSSIYETLYSYLESNDKQRVENTLPEYISHLAENVITQKFSEYFAQEYLGNEYLWAGCYVKKMVGINAQLNMELLYNETVELSIKKNWDKLFLAKFPQVLLKFVSDKQCTRHAKIKRQIQEIPNHHKLALAINEDSIVQKSDMLWRVNSVKDPEKLFAIVKKEQKKINHSLPCLLNCNKCNTCAHDYSCSCQVYSYDRTMCKHIHAVSLKFNIRLDPKEEPIAEGECSLDNSETDFSEDKKETNSVEPNIEEKPILPKYRKKRPIVFEEEQDILPVIQNILLNRTYRKRGRPKKHYPSLKTETDQDKEKNKRKRK